MKSKHQITPAAPDWTRAKGLLADLNSAVRRSLSAQVLLGKELSSIKKRLGFILGHNQWVPQVAEPSKSWGAWCKAELGVSVDTGDRWIRCFDAALKRAKARKAREPKACRLLEIPADELTGDELAALAEVIQGLVDGDTQAGLLEELRIVKPANPTPGGDTSNKSGNGDQVAFEQMVFDLFSEITSGLGQLEKKIFRGRSRAEFQAMLEWIPLASDDKNSPCLYAIRDSLRGVLDGELPKMIEAVESTIREKESPGMPAKRGRGKLTNA
jgi:hypothetical protein